MQKKYITALYERLSRDDEPPGKGLPEGGPVHGAAVAEKCQAYCHQ